MDVATDIGAGLKPLICGASHGVAAGSGDATAITGATIDRQGFLSADIIVGGKASVNTAETLKIAAEYQTSVLGDGSDWVTAVALEASATIVTGLTSAAVFQAEYRINLIGFPRYFRFNFTPDLSRSATDVFDVAAFAVLGGAATKPVSKTYRASAGY